MKENLRLFESVLEQKIETLKSKLKLMRVEEAKRQRKIETLQSANGPVFRSKQ
jgi:chaperonin cofactor prefoldin